MINESKYCSDVMKKDINKEFVMNKKDNEDFENSTKCWVCDNDGINGDVTVKDHCPITGKYRGSAHRDCNINVKLNQKLEKHISFSINNEFSFIGSFQFLGSSLDSLVKNVGKDDFK